MSELEDNSNFIQAVKLLTKNLSEYVNFSKYKNNTFKYGYDINTIYDNIKKWFIRKSDSNSEINEITYSTDSFQLNNFLQTLADFHNVLLQRKIPELTEISIDNKKKIIGRGRKSSIQEKWYVCDVCPRKFKTGAALGGYIKNNLNIIDKKILFIYKLYHAKTRQIWRLFLIKTILFGPYVLAASYSPHRSR